MSSSFAKDKLVGELKIYFGEICGTSGGPWSQISGTVNDMVTTLSAKKLPPTDASRIPDTIFISKGATDGAERSARVRFYWQTPGSKVDDALLKIFDTVKFAATCQCA